LRTALFQWAFVQANGGKLILRIEDTDQSRYVEGSIENIIEGLRWLGIEWDEGPDVGGPHGPYIQSERLAKYQTVAGELRARDRAYRCFCSSERLSQLRKDQQKDGLSPGYDGRCRAIPPIQAEERALTEPSVLRFRMDRTGVTNFHDLIRGDVTFQNSLQDDFVIIKTDGFPTYHLAMLVDDHDMEITHVIRAEEWLASGPKHLQLYDAMGWSPPHFAHLPLLVDAQGRKLSKRFGDVSALDYRDRGYLPEAMLNFLTFLGWSLDDKTTHITGDELKQAFTLDRVVPNPAFFDVERLDALNGHYIRSLNPEPWSKNVAEWLSRDLPTDVPRPLDSALVSALAPLLQERITRLDEVATLSRFMFGDRPDYPMDLLVERIDGDSELAALTLDEALSALGDIEPLDWGLGSVEAAIRGLQDRLDLKLRKFVSVLYVAIMGAPRGIPLFDSIALLGREEALIRLQGARSKLP
tara:strand:+ start:224 stop:1630 length:1407 start_codon:yes stop_codon:yes gene_type:complete